MTFEPLVPTMRMDPEQLRSDTWLIRQVQEAMGEPLFVYLNSMVITGAEPIIVDTGTIANRGQWLEDVFAIVDPADVRWVYLSHDDIDHTGNLAQVMDLCPHATLVCSWSIVERNVNSFDFPLTRCRWINDGDSLDAGDRQLRAVLPPLFDSPTSRGLLDERTGVYWGVDAFACPMPGAPVATVADLDPEFWEAGMAMFAHHALAPWLRWVDADRFAQHCAQIDALGASAIATAHSPLIEQRSIGDAVRIAARLPAITPPPCPDQAVLEAFLAATMPVAAMS